MQGGISFWSKTADLLDNNVSGNISARINQGRYLPWKNKIKMDENFKKILENSLTNLP